MKLRNCNVVGFLRSVLVVKAYEGLSQTASSFPAFAFSGLRLSSFRLSRSSPFQASDCLDLRLFRPSFFPAYLLSGLRFSSLRFFRLALFLDLHLFRPLLSLHCLQDLLRRFEL